MITKEFLRAKADRIEQLEKDVKALENLGPMQPMDVVSYRPYSNLEDYLEERLLKEVIARGITVLLREKDEELLIITEQVMEGGQ